MTSQQIKTNRYPTLSVLALLAVPGWCTAAATEIRPGEWEVTVRMEMPGMPAQAMASRHMPRRARKVGALPSGSRYLSDHERVLGKIVVMNDSVSKDH
jgi:hypothetical protein